MAAPWATVATGSPREGSLMPRVRTTGGATYPASAGRYSESAGPGCDESATPITGGDARV